MHKDRVASAITVEIGLSVEDAQVLYVILNRVGTDPDYTDTESDTADAIAAALWTRLSA